MEILDNLAQLLIIVICVGLFDPCHQECYGSLELRVCPLTQEQQFGSQVVVEL